MSSLVGRFEDLLPWNLVQVTLQHEDGHLLPDVWYVALSVVREPRPVPQYRVHQCEYATHRCKKTKNVKKALAKKSKTLRLITTICMYVGWSLRHSLLWCIDIHKWELVHCLCLFWIVLVPQHTNCSYNSPCNIIQPLAFL